MRLASVFRGQEKQDDRARYTLLGCRKPMFGGTPGTSLETLARLESSACGFTECFNGDDLAQGGCSAKMRTCQVKSPFQRAVQKLEVATKEVFSRRAIN